MSSILNDGSVADPDALLAIINENISVLDNFNMNYDYNSGNSDTDHLIQGGYRDYLSSDHDDEGGGRGGGDVQVSDDELRGVGILDSDGGNNKNRKGNSKTNSPAKPHYSGLSMQTRGIQNLVSETGAIHSKFAHHNAYNEGQQSDEEEYRRYNNNNVGSRVGTAASGGSGSSRVGTAASATRNRSNNKSASGSRKNKPSSPSSRSRKAAGGGGGGAMMDGGESVDSGTVTGSIMDVNDASDIEGGGGDFTNSMQRKLCVCVLVSKLVELFNCSAWICYKILQNTLIKVILFTFNAFSLFFILN